MFIEAPSFVIQRRIQRPLGDVQRGLADRTSLAPTRLLPLEPDGFLLVAEPFRPVAPLSSHQPSPTWCAPATLLTNRRQVVARVELALSMWSSDASELQVRPDARHPERWSSRRTGRYFALAHESADAVARVVVERITNAEHAREIETARQRRGADRVASFG